MLASNKTLAEDSVNHLILRSAATKAVTSTPVKEIAQKSIQQRHQYSSLE